LLWLAKKTGEGLVAFDCVEPRRLGSQLADVHPRGDPAWQCSSYRWLGGIHRAGGARIPARIGSTYFQRPGCGATPPVTTRSLLPEQAIAAEIARLFGLTSYPKSATWVICLPKRSKTLADWTASSLRTPVNRVFQVSATATKSASKYQFARDRSQGSHLTGFLPGTFLLKSSI